MAKHCLILKNRERHTKEDDMKRRRASSVDATTYDDCVAHPFKFPPKDLFENKDKKAPDNPPKSDVNAINPQNNTLWALIFAVFPDICPDYVERKHRELRERLHKIPDNEMLVDALLEAGTYPTLQERKRKKVKAEASPGKKDKWRVDDGFKRDRAYLDAARALLRVDFPDVPAEFLRKLLKLQGTLYSAYLELYRIDSKYDSANPPPYIRLRSGVKRTGSMPPFKNVYIPDAHKDVLPVEFQDARNARICKEEKLRAQAKIEQIEAENEAFHAATGGLVECKCCFSDCPVNRMISCTGDEAHFFCSTCIKKNVETQIGYMRYEISCVDTSQCKAGFSPTGLAEIIGTALVKKLDDLRQRDELDKAGIEGLEECPFCNFKAICPPLEEDREFRCMGPDCGKTSCRLCKLESHVPRTCEEITKERGVDARHQIEEAMTKAIVRICPNSRCKMPMIKDEGCNNLTCSKCQSRLCYVCKKDITKIAYNHFSRRPDSCQLYDQDEKVNRHYLEAVKAQQEATEEVLKANPQLQQKDIAVELPDKAPSRPRQRDNPFNDLLPNIGNIPWMGNDGRFPARVYQEAARRQPVQLAPAPPPDAQVPPFPNIPIPDPFLDMIPWPPTPRLAPAVPANIQQAQNAPPNLNPAAQLRQRLYEEQRFQRNRFMGTIPAVPQGNVPIAPRPEPRQPLHDHQLQFNSFAQNLAANMGPFPHPNPFMAQRADPPDARPPRKRFIVKKNF